MFFNPKSFTTSLVVNIKHQNSFVVENFFMEMLCKVCDTVFPELLQLYWNDCAYYFEGYGGNDLQETLSVSKASVDIKVVPYLWPQ